MTSLGLVITFAVVILTLAIVEAVLSRNGFDFYVAWVTHQPDGSKTYSIHRGWRRTRWAASYAINEAIAREMTDAGVVQHAHVLPHVGVEEVDDDS